MGLWLAERCTFSCPNRTRSGTLTIPKSLVDWWICRLKYNVGPGYIWYIILHCEISIIYNQKAGNEYQENILTTCRIKLWNRWFNGLIVEFQEKIGTRKYEVNDPVQLKWKVLTAKKKMRKGCSLFMHSTYCNIYLTRNFCKSILKVFLPLRVLQSNNIIFQWR